MLPIFRPCEGSVEKGEQDRRIADVASGEIDRPDLQRFFLACFVILLTAKGWRPRLPVGAASRVA